MGIGDFFDTGRFPARWHCGGWEDIALLGWMHILSDAAIALAYFSIPVVIVAFIRRRHEVQFPHLFWLFSAFILACGTTHVLDAVIFWYPLYPVAGLAKVATALVSIAALIAIIRVLPKALELPALAQVNRRLEAEIATRMEREATLSAQTAQLAAKDRRLLAAQVAGRIGDWELGPGQALIWSDQARTLLAQHFDGGVPTRWDDLLQRYRHGSGEALRQALDRAQRDGTSTPAIEAEVATTPTSDLLCHRVTIQADREDDGHLRIWGTIQDASDTFRIQQDLLRRSTDLARTNRDLEQFTALAAHDLLEPLRKARFFADLLRDDLGAALSGDGARNLDRLTASVERMDRIVRGLQALNRLGRGRIAAEVISLDAVVAEVLDQLQGEIESHGATIRVERLPAIRGDRALIPQVFHNLISNALRYAHVDRPPQIAISGVRMGNRTVVEVSDNGIGLAADEAERIFASFYRVAGSPQDGSGIGLAICRRIVEAHGGSIRALTDQQVGTAFRFEIPDRGEHENP